MKNDILMVMYYKGMTKGSEEQLLQYLSLPYQWRFAVMFY